MKRFDLLVMGELNVDLILNQLQEFPRMGTEILAHEMNLTMGSSSAIFACNAAALGGRVAFLGLLGLDDFGAYILKFLEGRGVNTGSVVQTEKVKTGTTIVLNFGQDRAMVTYPGAMELLSGEHLSEALLAEVRHLHLSSIFLQPGLRRDLLSVLRLAKKNGCTTSLDTQWDPAEKWELSLSEVLPLLDLFLPNEAEFLALSRAGSLEEGLKKFGPLGRTIAVKCGEKGAIAWSGGKLLKAGPYSNPEVVDAIGAGDSFDAGFVARFLQGGSVESCLHWGNLAGALNTTAAGGTTAFAEPRRIADITRKKFGVEFSSL